MACISAHSNARSQRSLPSLHTSQVRRECLRSTSTGPDCSPIVLSAHYDICAGAPVRCIWATSRVRVPD
jgi:hypothetical protein